MSDRSLLGLGIGGTILAALCCFTPILAVLSARVGLSALVGYLDMVLIPALVFFVALTTYAIWRRSRRPPQVKSGGEP
jgi:mercuric ion transport protein